MEIKIDGVVTDKIRNVYIAPAKQPGTTRLIYEGTLEGDSYYISTLFDKEFTLEYNGKTYTACRLQSTNSGFFEYFRVF